MATLEWLCSNGYEWLCLKEESGDKDDDVLGYEKVKESFAI